MDCAAASQFETRRVKKEGTVGDENLSKRVWHKAARVHLARGQVVMMEGTEDGALYFLLDGKAKAVLSDGNGREHIIYVVERGGVLGEFCLADDASSSLTFLAMDDCHYVMIRKNELLGMVRDDPSIALTILRSMSEKLRAASEKIRELSFCTVKDRILNYLLRVGRQSGEESKGFVVIENAPTHEEIADFCGCCRETVSRVIKELVAQGVLVRRKRSYTLRVA
jgi:CRP/FNR family cyclic AMP-dependent transcriptional regulator